MDDLHIEIMITLPPDWPLSSVNIEGLRSVGVSGSEWRLWLFQLEQALATGSGLTAGLTKWSRNLKKKFDNIEECYICYSIIYGKGKSCYIIVNYSQVQIVLYNYKVTWL